MSRMCQALSSPSSPGGNLKCANLRFSLVFGITKVMDCYIWYLQLGNNWRENWMTRQENSRGRAFCFTARSCATLSWEYSNIFFKWFCLCIRTLSDKHVMLKWESPALGKGILSNSQSKTGSWLYFPSVTINGRRFKMATNPPPPFLTLPLALEEEQISCHICQVVSIFKIGRARRGYTKS